MSLLRVLAATLLAVLMAAAEAPASSIAPRYPLVEEIARRNEKVPKSLRVSVGRLDFWPRGAARTLTLTATQRDRLRRLVEAHKRNVAGPFRAALRSAHPWMQQIALDALPQGRVSHGYEGAQLAMEAARRRDVAFVAGFLPELSTLARVPPAPKHGAWISWRAELAQECLGFLARLSYDEATVREALAHLVAGIAARPTRAGFEVLREALDARPEIVLTDAQKEALLPVVRDAMRDWFAYGKPDAPLVSLDAAAIAARLDDAETLDLLAQVIRKVNRYDFIHHLARGKHPTALEATRHVLRKGWEIVEGRQYEAAAVLRDPSLIPDLERSMERHGSTKLALDALLAIGNASAFVAIERRMEADVEAARRGASGLELSADAWLQTNPPDPERIRRHIKTLPGIGRVSLLVAMVKNGATDLFPAIRSYLDKPTIPEDVQLAAVRAMGLCARRDPAALAFLLETADAALHAWARGPDASYSPPGVWVAATTALKERGRLEPIVEEHLMRWWSLLRASKRNNGSQVVWVLGHIGDEDTLDFLRPLCAFPEAGASATEYLRLGAREAVGRIEARSGR